MVRGALLGGDELSGQPRVQRPKDVRQFMFTTQGE